MVRLTIRNVTFLLALTGAFLPTRGTKAQGVEDPPMSLPVAAWRVGVSGGVMTEPLFAGGTGPALVIDVARRLGRSVSLVGLGIASRASGEGLSSFGSYDYEREWLVAAIGVEAPLVRAPRVDVTVGVQGGAKWSRIREFSWVGTPPPGAPVPVGDEWDEGAMLVPNVHMSYRVSGPLVVNARLGSVTHIFTDNMIGHSGVLFTVGAALAW